MTNAGTGISSGQPAADLAKVMSAYSRHDYALASTLVDELLARYPRRADTLLAKAMVTMAVGDHDAAMDWFNASLEIDSDNVECLSWAAFLSLRLLRFQEAENLARRFSEVVPDQPRAHFLLATALRGQGKTEQALHAVDRALELQPDDQQTLVLKARLLKEWQFPALAVEFYRRAMALGPCPQAAIDMAQMYLKESHPQEALEILEQVMDVLPENKRPYDLVARAYSNLGRHDEAEPMWNLATQVAPDRYAVMQARAKADIAAGRFEAAEPARRTAVR